MTEERRRFSRCVGEKFGNPTITERRGEARHGHGTGVFPEFGLQVVARGTSKARFCGMSGQKVPTSWLRSWIRCPDCERKFNVARGRRFPTHVMNPKELA